METVVVATPLSHNLSFDSISFSEGIAIGQMPSILWEENFLKNCMSVEEAEDLSRRKQWLSTSMEVEDYHDQRLYQVAHNAMSALQIIDPRRAKNLYIRFRQTQQGLSITGSYLPKEMQCPTVANMASPNIDAIRKDFEKVNSGVNQALGEQIIRLGNPIVLLEHGLQIDHLYLSTLMWVMALDMLFMAEEQSLFVKRLTGFIGADTLVFPPMVGGFQADLTVKDIAKDLFQLRSIVAHGKKIPHKLFLEARKLINATGYCSVSDTYQGYSYCEILRAAALFLLVRSLRKIFVEGLIDRTRDDRNWKACLRAVARS